jgi:hypothetical protein
MLDYLESVAGLCRELRSILDTELVSGNQIKRVVDDGPGGWPLIIVLSRPFSCRHDRPSLLYRKVAGYAHYAHVGTGQILGCEFGDEG